MFKTSYQIRPVSGEYSCPRPTVWNVDELPLCKVHRRGLGSQLYRKKLPKLRQKSDIHQVIVDVKTFLGLTTVEKVLRRVHERRFLLDPDEAHALWVERLENQEKTGTAFLAELSGAITGRLELRPAQESDFYASLAMNALIRRTTSPAPPILGLIGAWLYITLLAAFVVPRIPTPCKVGVLHCCQTLKPVDDESVSSQLDRPEFVVPGLMVGVCAPIAATSIVADAQSCDGIFACCDHTIIGDIVHSDCRVISDAP